MQSAASIWRTTTRCDWSPSAADQPGQSLASARQAWQRRAGMLYPHFVDTPQERTHMSERAKLFTSGGSQAVRLPKAYRFEHQREVLITRRGQQVILEPTRRRWSRAFL